MIFWKFKATFRPFLLKNEDFSTFIKHCLKWQSLAVFTVAVAVTVQCDPFSDTVEDPASPGVFFTKNSCNLLVAHFRQAYERSRMN